jgi:type I restriction enzyme M protein
VVTIDEVKENDYNLSPSRYVSVIEEEKYRPIDEILSELHKIEKDRKEIEEKINKIFGNLNQK